MIRLLIIFALSTVLLSAIAPQEIVGHWHAYKKSVDHGSVTTEKEYLHLNANHTFNIQLYITIEKGDAFIKDLRIEGSGIWKNREDTLVINIQKVEVPFAKEIYRISQESLRNLANNFKSKYESEPLRIIQIEQYTGNQLITTNEKLQQTSYTRQ